MKKRQLVQTYGRHRQRVVSAVEQVWTSPGNSVFSSSNDSFLSQSGNTSTTGSSTSSRSGPYTRSQEEDELSWLQGDNVKRGKRGQNSKRVGKLLDESSENFPKRQKVYSKKNSRPALRERTNITNTDHIEEETPDKSKRIPKVTGRTGRKARNTTTTKSQNKSEIATHSYTVNKPEAEKKELSHNFSDFDSYDLVVESETQEPVSKDVREIASDSRVGSLQSTPYSEGRKTGHYLLRSQRKKAGTALTSTPHLYGGGKLHPNVSSRAPCSYPSPLHPSPAHLRPSPAHLHSFCDLEDTEGVNECTQNLDHLHLSGMSSIAESPANGQATGSQTNVLSGTPASTHSHQAILLKQCTVSLQRLRNHSFLREARDTRSLDSTAADQSLESCDQSVGVSDRVTRSMTKGRIRSEDSRVVSDCEASNSSEQFYSCSSTHHHRPQGTFTARGTNSTYTVEHSLHDPSADMFDSVTHSLHTRSINRASLQEVSAKLHSLRLLKEDLEQDPCVSISEEDDLSDLEEVNEDGADVSLYTLPSDEEELSVIQEEDEAPSKNGCVDRSYSIDTDPCGESESEASSDGSQLSDSKETDSDDEEKNKLDSEAGDSIILADSDNESETGEIETESEANSPVAEDVYWSDEDCLYLTANPTGHEKASPVRKHSSHAEVECLQTPSQNKSLRAKQLHQCCDSLKALTPVRCRKSGVTLSARDKVLLKCNQTEPVSFQQAITPSMLKKCVKIGEGVYGEVFKTERNKQSVALKVIPIEGDFEVNDEPQKNFEEMLPEIVISKELSALKDTEENTTPNFVEVKRVSVVQGSFPPQLLRQWDIFHKKKGSENDRPDMFGEEQLFIVFEFEECGCDLEGFKFESLDQARSVLLQVTCAFAVAETALQFEHRDLHWGNVLVKQTHQETLSYTLAGQSFQVETAGVKVSIIDFTLSRLCKDGCEVFCDLSTDPTLFEGQGDYQFQVYRLMKQENENNWRGFHPYTNVLWIHYLADKLLKGKTYDQITSREHKLMSRQFRTFLRDALDYQSALHLLKDCCFFAES